MHKVNLTFLLFAVLSAFSLSLYSGIEISDSVKEFRYPRFSKSGFIEWVLKGKSGSYDNSLVSVKAMDLRLYSGDASTELMCEVSSDFALLDTEKGITVSEGSILIEGEGFSISGVNWVWDSEGKVILIKDEVFVQFDQNIDALFTEKVGSKGTSIKSNYLKLSLEPKRYNFNFKNAVILESEAISLFSNQLNLELKNNASKQNDLRSMGEVSSMELVEGSGDTQLLLSGKEINSDSFVIHPQKETALFQGDAEITFNNVFLKGTSVAFDQSDISVKSSEGNQFCTLSISAPQAGSDLNSGIPVNEDVFIKSKEIMFSKSGMGYDFIFKDEVFYRSNLYLILSDWLRLKTHKLPNFEANGLNQSIIQSEAQGAVVVEHSDFKIRSDSMLYLPPENRLEISGNVFYQNDLAELKSEALSVLGNSVQASTPVGEGLVEVVLPYSYELGFNLENPANSLSSAAIFDSTLITANEFKMNTQKGSDECYFSQSVSVDRGDFKMTTDRLNINWLNQINQSGSREGYTIESVLAEGSVSLSEQAYSATSDKARITPESQLIELIGNAHLKDSGGSIWGEQINFDRRLQKTEVQGSAEGQRARIQFDLSDFEAEDKAEEVLEEK